ncbi:hypothetical protein EGW08_018115 [Elysia chlorotica]|uniref:Uncharacterized protein n=1 Tax=Elysia chlorotica TaxID=188477 RepID=A0A433SXT6_ELYCH|nr:hypothetical protein EGW08_018115 [Elysia chlorotica]
MATGGVSPCLDSNPNSNSGDVGVAGEGPAAITKRGKYYMPVNFSDDPTIRDYTSAVNANGPRVGEKGVAATDTSRGCSRCGACPGLSLHYWRYDYTSAVNANGPRVGEKGVAATDTSRGCSRCGACPGLSLHYWRPLECRSSGDAADVQTADVRVTDAPSIGFPRTAYGLFTLLTVATLVSQCPGSCYWPFRVLKLGPRFCLLLQAVESFSSNFPECNASLASYPGICHELFNHTKLTLEFNQSTIQGVPLRQDWSLLSPEVPPGCLPYHTRMLVFCHIRPGPVVFTEVVVQCFVQRSLSTHCPVPDLTPHLTRLWRSGPELFSFELGTL